MNFKEITIIVDTSRLEEAEAIAEMASSCGIYTEDYSDMEEKAWEIAHIDLIDEELLKKDRSKALIHIYIDEELPVENTVSFLKEQLTACSIEFILNEDIVSEDKWKDNWKQFFKCTEIGNRLTIRPSWEEYDNKENRTVLSIDPGAAFGTGTHATTLMCLEFLDEFVSGGEKVLDIGSGSGILAIASVLLGASRADGVDIDTIAVKVAKENAEINNISDKTNFICGDLAEQISGKYDIVCANIVADIIIRLCENVTDYIANGGVFVCSGIINTREAEVKEAIINAGMEIVKIYNTDGWTAIVAKP